MASKAQNTKSTKDNPSVKTHENIFATADWQNYDYQKDMANDPALQN